MSGKASEKGPSVSRAENKKRKDFSLVYFFPRIKMHAGGVGGGGGGGSYIKDPLEVRSNRVAIHAFYGRTKYLEFIQMRRPPVLPNEVVSLQSTREHKNRSCLVGSA